MITNVDVLTYSRKDFPVINLQLGDKNLILKEIEESISKFGFLVLDKSNIDLDLINSCYLQGKQFFELPKEIKMKYSARGSDADSLAVMGYHHFLSEKAVNQVVPDLKEFMHIGPLDRPASLRNCYSEDNKWPIETPGFETTYKLLYKQMSELAINLLDLIAEIYGLSRGYMKELLELQDSLLRPIYYPANDKTLANKGALRAAAHTGINLIGLLCPGTASGLQFLTPSGQWVRLKQGEFTDCISVNMGEMLQFLTNGKIEATLHRVVNEQDEVETKVRQAIVFFVHPNLALELKKQTDDGDVESVVAGEWQLSRVKEIKYE